MTRELETLRRALAQKKPYSQHLQDQEIKRLKKELHDANQSLRENVAVIKQERDGPNKGLELVDTAVQYTNKIQIEKRRLEQENSELKQKLSKLQSSIREGDTERERFFEGASWAAKQCVLACDSGNGKFDTLRRQYNDRIHECESDHFMRMRAAEWLLDSSARLMREVKDESQTVLEKSIRQQATAQQLLTHL